MQRIVVFGSLAEYKLLVSAIWVVMLYWRNKSGGIAEIYELIATEIHGMTLLLYFEAFSLSVHELLTTLLRQTKNCQQATNDCC